MEAFAELTDADVLALSDEAIEVYVNIACAEEGVPFLPAMPVEPPKAEKAYDVTLYEAGGAQFTDPDDAQRVVATINAAKSRVATGYVSGPSYERRVLSDEPAEEKITPKGVFTTAGWVAQRDVIMAHDAARKAYERAKSDYDSIEERRTDIREGIDERVARVRSAAAHRDRMMANFEPYRTLANGDATVAMRFYRRATYLPDDVIEDLVPGFAATEAAADERAQPAPDADEDDAPCI